MHFLHPLVEIRKSCTIPADNFRYNIYLKCSSKNTLYLLSRNHLLIFYIFMLFYTFASIHCILTYFVACILLLTFSIYFLDTQQKPEKSSRRSFPRFKCTLILLTQPLLHHFIFPMKNVVN